MPVGGFSPPLFLTCTTRPSRASCLPFTANFPLLVLIGSPILLPLVLLFPISSPQKSRSPRPADSGWKKGGADIAASPSILVALLICCSARNNAHVGDLCVLQDKMCTDALSVSFRTRCAQMHSHPCRLQPLGSLNRRTFSFVDSRPANSLL